MGELYGGHLETKEQVITAVQQHGLSHLIDTLEPLIRPSMRLIYADPQPDAYALGTSRIGGLPDLPPELEWPQWPGEGEPDEYGYEPAGPLSFLAQINLAEISPYNVEGLLPSSGMLYFFAAQWVNCVSDYESSTGLWRVLYYDDDLSTLRRVPAPFVSEELRADRQYLDNAPEDHQFKPCALAFALEMTLPNNSYYTPIYPALKLSDEDAERYAALVQAVSPEVAGDPPIEYPPIHRMLGHPQCSQVYASDADAALLLQLDTDLNPANPSNLYWEFGGRGYFFIQPDDLQARDFSNIKLVYECH